MPLYLMNFLTKTVLCIAITTYYNTQKHRGDWIRTSDLLNPIQARFRAAPRPEKM